MIRRLVIVVGLLAAGTALPACQDFDGGCGLPWTWSGVNCFDASGIHGELRLAP